MILALTKSWREPTTQSAMEKEPEEGQEEVCDDRGKGGAMGAGEGGGEEEEGNPLSGDASQMKGLGRAPESGLLTAGGQST